MTERIFGDRVEKVIERDGCTESIVRMQAEPKEEIVRCRDCSMSLNNGEACWYFAYEEWGETVPVIVKPDGFCAWGEKVDE